MARLTHDSRKKIERTAVAAIVRDCRALTTALLIAISHRWWPCKKRVLKASMFTLSGKNKAVGVARKKSNARPAEERRSGIITRGLDDSARLSLNKHGD